MQACASSLQPAKLQLRPDRPSVAILLATYNGERYLAEQLDSLLAQSHPNWELHVSDDGSDDTTTDILEAYRPRLGERMRVRYGPKQGFSANFLSLALADIDADYFAFCDQDDLWHPNKLERALEWLQLQDPTRPALYCSRTRLIDIQGNVIGHSPLFGKHPSFRNALVQSIAGGNTMVFNTALKRLIEQAGRQAVISHDWWLYMLTSGCQGIIFYDPIPAIDYRQHPNNIVGANTSLIAKAKRVRNVMSGHFLHWNEINLNALGPCRHLLCAESQGVLTHFANARQASVIPRLTGILRSGVYRQGPLENLALLAAAILRKV